MLQEADNFYLGTGIVSRLYLGNTLLWPFPGGDFWQFFDNPFGKTLSNFKVIYTSGNVIANWEPNSSTNIVSNTNYNYTWGERPLDDDYILNDGKYQIAASKQAESRIYLSKDYGQTWVATGEVSGWRGVAISHDAKYQTAVVNSGGIFVSNNSGQNFIEKISTPRAWYRVAMSSNGKYQTAIVSRNNFTYEDLLPNNIYVSNDYGETWNPKFSVPNNGNLVNLCVSSDGKFQVTNTYVGGPGSEGLFSGLYISKDYGETWSGANIGPGTYTSVGMSADGKYITLSAFFTEGGVVISNNSGISFNILSISPNSAMHDVSVSNDGKYQSIVDVADNGRIWVSNNYGLQNSWAPKGPILDFPKKWYNIAMNGDGKYQIANGVSELYGSNDYGNTWSQRDSLRDWMDIAISRKSIAIPAAPSQPTTTNVNDISFTANWNSVPTAINYRLDVATDNNFTNYVIGYNNLTVNGTSQIVNNLSAFTTYWIRVRAANEDGISNNSQYIGRVTATAMPNQPTSSNVTSNGFTLSWNVVPNANQYRLDIATNSSFTNFVVGYNDKAIYTNSEIVTGLSANTTYYIRVRSANVTSSPSRSSPTLTQSTLAICPECGGTATLINDGGGTVCIGVPDLSFNSSDIVPANFDCNYTPSSYMIYPTSLCGAAIEGSYLADPSRCGSLANIGKPYYKALLAGGGERQIIPGLTFAQCGIGQGLHTYYVILCVNSCASAQGAIKTKSYPSQLWIN
jgi:hypothetical protein